MATLPALTALLAVPVTSPAATPPGPSPVVGSHLVADTDLPDLRDRPAGEVPLTVVVGGGAGQIAGPAGYCARGGLPLGALRIALRDLDDPAGNARRVVAAVDAARAEGALAEEVEVQVAVPATAPTYSWLAAADEIAAAELHLALDVRAPAGVLAAWFEAALDRETPYACLGGDGHALSAGTRAPGFLALLAATVTSFDGGSADDVAAALGLAEATGADLDELARGRRWLTRVDCPDPGRARADLDALGLSWGGSGV